MRKQLFLALGMLCLCAQIFGQTRQVSGNVQNDSGEPVPNASVVVRGSKTGVVADESGNFTINAATGTFLTITAAGYESQTISSGSGDFIQVILISNTTLTEVVVTAMGIRRTDKSLGYSISKVNPDMINQKSEPDLLKGLQGKVAGVDIRSSQGTPGAATKINIRGFTSFYGNNEPLIVVDGIPYNNDQVATSSQTSGGGAYSSGLSALDPNDIANISVLKGAAAAALYGSRASNGALIITTKSGSAGASSNKREVTFTSSYSFENIASLPDYQNDYGAGTLFEYQNSNGSWGQRFGTIDSINAWGDFLNAFPELFPNGKTPYRAYPNNVKDLFRTGSVFENSVTASGGNDRSAISATASFLSQDGYVPNSSFKRGNLSVGGMTKLNNGLQVSGNFSYSNSTQVGGVFGENQVDGAASSFARTLFLARNWNLNLPYEDQLGNPVSTSSAQYDNPRWSWQHNTVTTRSDRYVAGLKFNYDITPWFNLGYQIGTNTNGFHRQEITDKGSRAAETVGRIKEEDYQFREVESNLMANFTPELNNDDFTVRGLLGYNVNHREMRSKTMTGNEIVVDKIFALTNTKSVLPNVDSEKRRLYGIYASAELEYKSMLYLTLTGRNDWSSTLPKENNSYFYPSASLAFIFTEAFDMGNAVLNFGKVRTSWAKVGRDADPYSLRTIFNVNNIFQGISGATRDNEAGNDNLKPEFTQDFEVGTQLEFLRSRITLDFAWYSRSSTNQIASLPIPASSGYQFVVENFGKMNNKGIEIDLGVTPVKTEHFTWNLHGIFTKNKNEVVSLTPGVDRILLAGILSDISPYIEPGKPYGYLRGSMNVRDDDGNLLINPSTGMLIRAPEQGMIGNPNPDFKAGLNTTLNYKGFFISALFDLTKGGDMYSVTVSSLLGRGVTKDTRDRETAFIIPGVYGNADTYKPLLDDKGQTIPNTTLLSMNELYFGETYAINAANEWNVYDATVYTFRELTLGYEFPKKMFDSTPIGGLSLTLTGRNLWYNAPNFPKYSRFNPEAASFGNTNVQGIELSAAPTMRRFGVNLKVTF